MQNRLLHLRAGCRGGGWWLGERTPLASKLTQSHASRSVHVNRVGRTHDRTHHRSHRVTASPRMDLFLVSRADIFAIYPKILKEILHSEEQKRAQDGYLPKDHVQLPSDVDFQDRVYYRLLAVQRTINEQVDSGR